jgi:hypothetical protein
MSIKSLYILIPVFFALQEDNGKYPHENKFQFGEYQKKKVTKICCQAKFSKLHHLQWTPGRSEKQEG